MHTLTIALLGRPNVGKSTLFNRLVGKKKALVHAQPGMTRDRRVEELLINDCSFRIMDTPGLEFPRDTELKQNMWTQSMKALEDADLAVWLVDGREGLTAVDWEIGEQLRKEKKTIILVVNKCEGASHRFDLGDFYKLGFGEPILLSAEHGEGIGDLYDVMFQNYPHLEEYIQDEMPSRAQGIRVCLVGRPNAGKSTLLNQWIGEDRVIVTDIPGTTRDSIEVPFFYKDPQGQDHQLILVDTAGLRKKAKIQEGMEVLSAQNTLHAIQFSHVVVVLVDATSPLDKQDFNIARHVIEEGRAVVLAINKWDLISQGDREKYKKSIDEMVGSGLSAVSGIPVVYLSALKNKGTDAVLEAVLTVETIWNKTLPKNALNSWLESVQEQHLPPLIRGRRLRFKYVNQIKSRPPTFLLFANQTKDVPDSYLRFLTNKLRTTFDLPGVPIRWILRSSHNPYV